MPVAVVHEWAEGGNDTTNYDAINARMGTRERPPAGIIVHTAGATEGGGFRIFDVWESREDYERFEHERPMPAVQETIAGSTSPPAPPTVSIYPLYAFERA
jgi:hypothetical protein